jgi:hypothetical protein
VSNLLKVMLFSIVIIGTALKWIKMEHCEYLDGRNSCSMAICFIEIRDYSSDD